jgi:anti-anti-sigma factor
VGELATIDVEQRGSTCLLRVRGEVDMSNARDVSAALEQAMPNGVTTVAVDLGQTTYLDSAGIQLLFQLAERLKVRRHDLVVIVPEDAPIRAALELTGLSKVVRLEDRLD